MTDARRGLRGRVLLDGVLRDDHVVVVEDARIAEVVPGEGLVDRPGLTVIDTHDAIISPGFIDLHIHGSGGAAAESDAAQMARHVLLAGCTYLVPTLMTQDLAAMLAGVEQVRQVIGPRPGSATIGGIHLEGPFLNPRYGAQQERFVVPPSDEVAERLLAACDGDLALVTVAPEMDGAIEAIRRFVAAGAVAAIGHTDASEADFHRGREAGITHVTHLFNAMPAHDRMAGQPYSGVREVGVDDLVLADPELSVDIVADSVCVHVHRAQLNIALQCLGSDRLSLITDAMPAAGLPPGTHSRSDDELITTAEHEDVARMSNGLLSGSAMMMHGAIQNLSRWAPAPIEVALRMATEAPARVLGIADRKGLIAPGMDADLVVLEASEDIPSLTVRQVLVAGRDVVVDGHALPTVRPSPAEA